MKSRSYQSSSSVELRGPSPVDMFRASVRAGLATLCLFMSSGCAHYTVNQRIENYEPMVSGYLEPTEEQRSDDLLLVLAFSGGGTRAAALSYGVLEAVDKISIPESGGEVETHGGEGRKTLLDQVDMISSVSGGSVTAAYYALYGEQIFDDFKAGFLYRNVNRGQPTSLPASTLGSPQRISRLYVRTSIASLSLEGWLHPQRSQVLSLQLHSATMPARAASNQNHG
ncbi:MAG: patatin-like phospholipase family protein [Candidatus Lindowbacteria bacterium]|nr:patatin-like phospholipase family protein [Candidatus Lindowbacteria bacterium]